MILSGQSVDYPKNLSFGQYMFDGIRRIPGDNVCMENGITRETLTYKEMTQYIVNVAAGLLKQGVKRGDVVAIGSEPFLHAIPTTLAIIMTGATSTYFDLDNGEAITKHKLQLTKPTHLICSSQFWNTYQHLLKGLDCIKTYLALSAIPEMSSLISLTDVDVDVESFKANNVQDTDIAFIMYSSGTTAMPKGVEMTHYCCIARCDTSRQKLPWQRALYISPFSAAFTIYGISTFLLDGGKIVFTCERSTKTLLSAIRNCKVDIILSNPVHIRDIANSELRQDHMDSVKYLICAGFSMSADMIQMFKESFTNVEKIVQMYGMTECGVSSELLTPACRPGSVGFVFPGHQIKIVEPITQAVLGPNEHGEIRVKGPTLMKGYIDIDMSDYMDEEGFFKTGDICYFDDDQYLYVVDRIKDLIFGKFAKVSPLEIEHILLQHPAVLDVGVVGKPDPVLNEVPAAFIVKKPEFDVSGSELMDFVASKASPHMQIKAVRFVQTIPRNNRGKTLRQQLKVMLEESE